MRAALFFEQKEAIKAGDEVREHGRVRWAVANEATAILFPRAPEPPKAANIHLARLAR